MKPGGAVPRGFLMPELLVAAAILAVLAALAVPAYGDHVTRSRRFEARVGLLEAAHWLERWRTEHGRYDDPDHPGQPPAGFPWRQVPRVGTARYAVVVTVTPIRYRITATPVPPMAGDPCESLSIDETGQRGFSGPRGTFDLCWVR